MYVDIVQSVESLNRTKRERKGKFVLCLSWVINLPLNISAPGSQTFKLELTLIPLAPWFLGLWTPGVTYSINPRGSQVFGFGLNYTTIFPRFPACRQKIVELLGPHDHVSQWQMIHPSYWFCFSGEPWLIQANIVGFLIFFLNQSVNFF